MNHKLIYKDHFLIDPSYILLKKQGCDNQRYLNSV